MNDRTVIFYCLALFASPALAGDISMVNCALEAEQVRRFSCDVQNGADRAVAQLGYTIEVYEEGRTVPWAEDTRMIDVPGGIEPGETISLSFVTPAIPERAAGRTLSIRVSGIVGYDVGRVPVNQSPIETPIEFRDIEITTKQCWNVGALSTEALFQTVRLSVEVDPNGLPSSQSIRLLNPEGNVSAAVRQAYEAARRAIIRCSVGWPDDRPYPKSLIFTFSAANGLMVVSGGSDQE